MLTYFIYCKSSLIIIHIIFRMSKKHKFYVLIFIITINKLIGNYSLCTRDLNSKS